MSQRAPQLFEAAAPSGPVPEAGGRLRLSCFVAELIAGLAGGNMVTVKRAGIERVMRNAGLAAGDARLGPDTLHYWLGGAGPTVVLLHGFGGSATWLWYPQVAALARDHRLVVPDLLWFGDSQSDDRDFTIDHQVRALATLLDSLGDRAWDLVGVSYGGLVAHELASYRPTAARNLVLVDTPGRVYTLLDYHLLCKRHLPHPRRSDERRGDGGRNHMDRRARKREEPRDHRQGASRMRL